MRKANILTTLPSGTQNDILSLPSDERNQRLGIGCDVQIESQPVYSKAPCETVQEGSNNQYIVFGRDRNGPRYVSSKYDNGDSLGPYGPKGYTGCGMIDMVVGRFDPQSSISDYEVDPDFIKDSARIYISQLTDIDSNFHIGRKENRQNEGRSGIGIKADAVRIVGRENIKLVTKTDKKNSLGGEIYRADGIEQIAGNDERDLQPIPKGDNLQECIEHLTNHVQKQNGIINSFIEYQMDYNEKISTHTHISPFYALPTMPSEVLMIEGRKILLQMMKDVKVGIINHRINLSNYTSKYLKESGRKYINSRYNKVN